MSTPATEAKKRYNAKAYDKHTIYFPKGKKEEYTIKAQAKGKTLNAYIIELLNEK